jgi:hypothetical protein
VNEQGILEIAESGDAGLLHGQVRERALASLYYFSKAILGYQLVSHLHLPFCNELQATIQDRKRGFLLPRGTYKSTIVSKSYPLWRYLSNQNIRVLIVGESDPVACKNLKDIKWNVENNQLFRWAFPEAIPPDINKTVWNESEILLPRQRSFDESTITATGVGSRVTGKHFDLIVYDDIIGEKAAGSEAEMETAKEWFRYAPGLLADPAISEELIIGTRWKYGAADLYGWIMQELPFMEVQ